MKNNRGLSSTHWEVAVCPSSPLLSECGGVSVTSSPEMQTRFCLAGLSSRCRAQATQAAVWPRTRNGGSVKIYTSPSWRGESHPTGKIDGRGSRVLGASILEPFEVRTKRPGLYTLGRTEAFLSFALRPEIGRDYPLNLSISLRGGKETNEDSLSNGE